MEDFIKKLSIETEFSYDQSKQLVNKIKNIGDVDLAKKIYKEKGFFALIGYVFIHDYNYWQQWEDHFMGL